MSMAVADCVVLLASVPNEILYYYLVGNLWIWGDVGCAGFIFFQNLGINASSLSLVAFTVERYIAICHPLKAHTVCTLSRARRIVYGVWVFATVYCCPWLGLTTTRLLGYKGYPGARSCDFKLPRHHYLAYFFADLIVFYVLPLIVSCVLYGLITRVLFTRRFGVNKSNTRLQGNATASTSSSKDQYFPVPWLLVQRYLYDMFRCYDGIILRSDGN
uniref:Thyrotropin-releasing hormone receptor n=1 Tax=Timema douglasi TaxID=61478 RepID=A0A7R8VIK5_TIMDO|nr:unnamed protein product [Timema douglasi]